MKKNILTEELERILFLSHYDKNKTYEDNLQFIEEQVKDVISKASKASSAEKTLANELKLFTAAEKRVLSQEIKSGNIVKTDGKYVQDADDLFRSLEKGLIKDANLAKSYAAIFKSTKNVQILERIAPKLKNAVEKAKQAAEKANKDLRTYLKNPPKNYSDEAINALEKAHPTPFKPKTGTVPGKQPTSPGGAGQTALNNPEAVNTAKKIGKFEKFKNWVKANPKKAATWFGVSIVTVGALVYFWNSLFPEEILPVTTDDQTPVTDGGGGGGGTSSGFQDCPDFPLTQGCRSTNIGKIQDCLNKKGAGLKVDNLFGRRTSAALTKYGYDANITQAVYDKIMADCGTTAAATTDQGVDDPYGEYATATPEGE